MGERFGAIGRMIGADRSLRRALPGSAQRRAAAAADAETAAASPLPRAARRRATVGLLIATAMQAFDATIANVALPQLERSLGVGIGLGIWVMTSYLC
ncbi:MAG TPA: hypothetical protein VFQ82_14160, partial [Stellaceae bacterium]|nr:hypothetical protein [Stellaceae bacterium]